MNKLRVVICVVLAGVFAAQLMVAQEGMGPQGGSNKRESAAKLEALSNELQLTPAQKQQLLPILREEAPQIQAVKSNSSLPPMQKAMQLKQISTAVDAKVMPILNPEQQQKWQAIREQERRQMMQKLENR